MIRSGITVLLLAKLVVAQTTEGSLTVVVRDPSGQALPATVVLASRTASFQAEARAVQQEGVRFNRLPPGPYQVSASYSGFETKSKTVEIRSAVPQSVLLTLPLSAVSTEIVVQDTAPLLDPLQSVAIYHAGRRQLAETAGTTLGRSTIDVITTMPGWLLEANAVLHPRGSEYDTQYVVDGLPLYDNRSLAFAPPFENHEFESVSVLTGGIPAEYGRRLGGVITLDSRRAPDAGHRLGIAAQAGTYDNYLGSLSYGFRKASTALTSGVYAGRTDRYLDPPSSDNFTNKASAGGVSLRLDQELSTQDRLSFYVRSNRTGFLVPNDREQQAAGQRQDRAVAETLGQVHYRRTLGPNKLAAFQGMVRDLTARLWSNPLATPIWADGDRGFREGAFMGTLTVENEQHTLRFGGDVRLNQLRERFQFAEADDYPELELDFADSRRSTESSFFVQDHLRLGNFAANIGLRFDYYKLFISDTAISPRIALSYYVPAADLLLRAAYDRVFQPPPAENLLLSSAATGFGLDDIEDAIPVPPSRGNFFEVGLRKPIANRLRFDVTHYWRTFRNYIDDDVFLNTGLSFPITFDTARITGTEARLELPDWRGISSFISYANMTGTATSPVTGGLFVEGGEADELRSTVERFPISQDQRNTLAAQVRFQPHRRLWTSVGFRYGSGLPVEIEDDDDDEEEWDDGDDDDDDDNDESDDHPGSAVDEEILRKIDFERGRIKPNYSLDFSAGLALWQEAARSAVLQFDLRNATDRLNVINFSGLFSGTALAPGRQFTIQLRLRL